MKPIVMWHGSHRWDPPPEVRPAPEQSLYHGPGIYMTTSTDTAHEYAKGGGALIRLEIDPEISLAEDVFIPLQVAIVFLRSQPRLKNRAKIEADVEMVGRRLGKGAITAENLVNLFVNYQAAGGKHGPALARFLVSRGADASVVTRGLDDWLVLMNPSKIWKWERVSYREAKDAERGLYGRLKKSRESATASRR